jgi:ribosomal protein S12 methylthiotransferase
LSDRRKVSLISLGCPKNLVDSEGLVSRLLSSGIDVVVDPADADVAIVNTCGFLGSSRDESLATIARVAKLKESGLKGVVVTGCMVGHYGDIIKKAAPEVDRLVDFQDYRKIADLVGEIVPPPPGPRSPFTQPGRYVQARLTPAHFAYLKISEGCDHTCTFCVIPAIRGPMRSVPLEELVTRARRLVELGAKELNLVAQDSTIYGVDIYGRRRLADLMRALSEIDGLRWIRLLYAYPTEIDEALLDVLAQGGKVIPYIDVPFQHSEGRMLKSMARRSTAAGIDELVDRLRARVPEIAIRTTFIVGFPGETEREFGHLMDFVARKKLERVGAFMYSHEPGSAAFDLPGQVDESVKAERLDRLMRLQSEIAAQHQTALVGQTVEVLIDDPGKEGEAAIGRTRSDAPEIDGKAHVTGARLPAGALVRMRVRRAEAYDLYGEVEG